MAPQEEPARDSPMKLTEMLFEELCLLDIKNSIKSGNTPQGHNLLLVLFVHLSFCFVTVLAARTFLNKLFFNVNELCSFFFFLFTMDKE